VLKGVSRAILSTRQWHSARRCCQGPTPNASSGSHVATRSTPNGCALYCTYSQIKLCNNQRADPATDALHLPEFCMPYTVNHRGLATQAGDQRLCLPTRELLLEMCLRLSSTCPSAAPCKIVQNLSHLRSLHATLTGPFTQCCSLLLNVHRQDLAYGCISARLTWPQGARL
jgi:hypothetical protein